MMLSSLRCDRSLSFPHLIKTTEITIEFEISSTKLTGTIYFSFIMYISAQALLASVISNENCCYLLFHVVNL